MSMLLLSCVGAGGTAAGGSNDLLMEDGSYLLLEDSGKIILES